MIDGSTTRLLAPNHITEFRHKERTVTKPTADDVRAMTAGRELDRLVHELVYGWTDFHLHTTSGSWMGKPPGWDDLKLVVGVSTDPAASAELRRHLWASGRYGWMMCQHDHTGCRVTLDPDTGDPYRLSACEPVTGDPVAAECCAWAKAACLAVVGG